MSELITTIPVDKFVAARDLVIQKLERIAELSLECAELMSSHQLGDFARTLINSRVRNAHFIAITDGHDFLRNVKSGEWMKNVTRDVDAQAWNSLMKHSGMLALMDAARRQEWNKTIINKTTPPLAVPMINDTFATLYEDKDTILVDGVIGVFKALSWDHKTNIPHKFSQKLIISRFRQEFSGMCMDKCNMLDDLVRVLRVFDGKPQLTESLLMYSALDRHYPRSFDKVDLREIGNFTNEYFSIRLFKNGNCHVLFHDEIFVDKLNLMMHSRYPNALPPLAK